MVKRSLVAALLLALPAAAQQVTETTLPLADPDARAFRFMGNIGLAIDFDGSGKVTARVNAYDLSRPAFAWRQEIRIQESDKSRGGYLTTQAEDNRLYFGNGPLTAVEATTGRILWSLDCKTAGSIDFRSARQFADGMLLRGTQGCGELDRVRILRIDLASGAVRWTADADAHRYNTGKDNEHRDFVMYYEGPSSADLLRMAAGDSAAVDSAFRALSGAPTQLILAGEHLQGIDYATGRPAWSVPEKPGRWVELAPAGLSLWMDDEDLVAYSTRDGSKLWTYDLGAPWGFFWNADTSATSDIIVVTWKNAHRIDRSGHAKWSVRRENENWGQGLLGPLLVLAMKPKHWAAVDVATGQVRWTTKVVADGAGGLVVEELSPATGVVLIEGRTDGDPKSLTAYDAPTGRVLWTLERVGRATLEWYVVVNGTRLIVKFEGKPPTEYDVRTGAAGQPYAGGTASTRSPLRVARSELAGQRATAADGHYVEYNDERLTCYSPDGQALWTRRGEMAEFARLAILPQGVVVWTTKDGKVELIALRSGNTLHTAMGNSKPRVGVDMAGGRVLVPSGKSIKILTVSVAATN